MRQPWGWVVGVLSSTAGACGIAGRAIMDTIGLANLPSDAGSGAQAFAAAVLWLASTGPVGAYVFNGLLLVVGVQKASEVEAPLVKEMGDLVRGKIVNSYDHALEFLDIVDKEVGRMGSLWLDEPQQLWQAISKVILKPFLQGFNLRSYPLRHLRRTAIYTNSNTSFM